MNKYIGKICPYCKTVFSENDDIVVCSDCDMPHHKDCWIENQGCTTFGCMGSIKADDGSATTVTTTQLEYDIINRTKQYVFCTRCGKENNANSSFCYNCGAQLTVNFVHTDVKNTFTPAVSNDTDPYGYTKKQTGEYQQSPQYENVTYSSPFTETIDADMVLLIGKNAEYYIPKFQKMKSQNKKNSWNWCAFLVTPYWLIYRKMYGYGFGFLAASFVISLIESVFLSFLSLAGYIIFGIFANYIYMKYIENKTAQVRSISDEYKNQFIYKNGGVNPTVTILTVIAYALLVLIAHL